MKKVDLFRLIRTACIIVILLMAFIRFGYSIANHLDKPISETPFWLWFWFM
jgi:hypothetical protein